MSMDIEQLQEGWVIFRRIHFKDGYIDRWSGDSINDPNNPTQHNLQLNSTRAYYRCNNSKWVSNRRINGAMLQLTEAERNDNTAQEWFVKNGGEE